MRVFPRKGSLRSRASYASTPHWPEQHYPAKEYSVVLLGVMYPSSVQERQHGIEPDESRLPQETLNNRRSTDLIFYDPIRTSESRIPQPDRKPVLERKERLTGTRNPSRRASIEAVVRDLAVLLLRKPI